MTSLRNKDVDRKTAELIFGRQRLQTRVSTTSSVSAGKQHIIGRLHQFTKHCDLATKFTSMYGACNREHVQESHKNSLYFDDFEKNPRFANTDFVPGGRNQIKFWELATSL